jgi:hypothetical protein
MSRAHEILDLNETLLEYPTWEPGTTNPFVNDVEDADSNDSDVLTCNDQLNKDIVKYIEIDSEVSSWKVLLHYEA